jgi:hypothetical protein
MIAQLDEAIRDSDQLGKDRRAELRGVISTKPGLNRYLIGPAALTTSSRPAHRRATVAGLYFFSNYHNPL